MPDKNNAIVRGSWQLRKSGLDACCKKISSMRPGTDCDDYATVTSPIESWLWQRRFCQFGSVQSLYILQKQYFGGLSSNLAAKFCVFDQRKSKGWNYFGQLA